MDYENSEIEEVKKAKEFKKRFEKVEQKIRLAEEKKTKISSIDLQEQKEVIDELTKLASQDIKQMIKETYQQGLDLPDEMKDALKQTPLAG